MDSVRQMLCRHVTSKNSVESEKERFVVEQLHVPVEWVHEAKVSSICTHICYESGTVTCETTNIVHCFTVKLNNRYRM